MTEQEYQQVYQELVTILQDLQLDWIVKQVEAKNQAGEVLEDLAVQPGTNTAQAVLVKPEISMAQAQLLSLIDAVERIVVGSIEIEGALVDFLVEESNRSQSRMTLSFESESAPVLSSSDVGLMERQSAIAQLWKILQALHQEASLGVE